MTTYTFPDPINMTEFFENDKLYLMTNSDLYNNSINKSPFYYEASTNTVNFVYGINLQSAANNSTLKAEIETILSGLGVTISSSQWASIGNLTTSSSALQSITSALNGVVESQFPSAIQNAANTLTEYYMDNVADNGIQSKLNIYNANVDSLHQVVFDDLPPGIQAALEDLDYNTGSGTFIGPKLFDALSNKDYASAAYELAYDTAPSSDLNSNYEKRALADAALILGFNVTLDENHQIVSLVPNAEMDTATIIKFMELKAFGLHSTSIQKFEDALTNSSFLFGATVAPASWWGLTFSSPKTGSPIILDLTGDGVTTLAASAGTYFDLRNTGFAQLTGWAAPTDGLLVWDRNSNGVIDDGAELFGNYTQTSGGATAANGFAALASYDTNHDGVINASDPIWSNLKIWVDANSNGVTDPGELHSLSSLGIASLNLSYADEGATVPADPAGNRQEFVGSYTTTGGATQMNCQIQVISAVMKKSLYAEYG